MADLLSWFGDRIKDVEHGVGGFVNDVSHAVAPQQPRQPIRPPQVGIQRPQAQQRPQAPQFRPSIPNVSSFSQNSVVNRTKPQAPQFNPAKAIGDFGKGVVGTGEDIVKGTISTGQKLANTGVAAATGVMGALSPDQAFKDAAIAQRKDIFNNSRTITGDKGTFFDNYDQAMNTNGNLAGNTVAPALRAVSEVAPLVLPFGKFAGSVPVQLLKSGVANAAVGGATNAASQYANTGKVDLGQVGQSALTSGVIGAAIPAASKFVQLAKDVHANDMNPQAGFAKVPFNKNQETLFNAEPIQAAPTLPKLKQQEVATANKPQVPALPPEQALANKADGGAVRLNGQLDIPNPQKNTRYASKTIPESEFVGEQVGGQTKANAPKYTPETERGRYTQTLRNADQQGFANFENDVHNRLNSEHIDSQTVADAQAVAQRLEVKGDDVSLRRAADIYDKVSGHLTKNGQTIQAAAIMSRRTPAGMKYQALNDIRKSGKQITPELQRQLQTHVDAIAKTKVGSDTRKKAIGELAKAVEHEIPQGAVSNLVSVWKAGLLSGVKTTQGNIISNATFGGLNRISNPATVFADNAMAVFTGKRTATATLRGIGGGTKEGVEKGWHTLKTGVDLRNASDKYELHKGINFKNKVVQKYLGTPAQKVFDFMGAQDQPFYFAQLRNSIHDLAKADGINKGLKGKELSDHMDEMLKNPTEEILQRATDDAAKAVLGYDTPVSKAIQGAKKGIDQMPISDVGKQASHAVIDILAPFVRVPTAFLARSIDYTPLGIGKTVLSQIARKQFDQRALAKAIGEGVTGTGIIALGAALSNSGDVSGDYPTDPKEQQLWKSQKKTPNSVKLGGQWVSLNYLGPIGMLFGAGKKFVDASKKGEDAIGSTAAAIGGFGQTLLGQSFLQGLSGFIDAAQDPERYLEGFVNSQAGSVVPSIVNDFGNLTDDFKRDVNNGFESIMSRIPGVRNNLNKKQDVFGNPITQTPAETLTAFKPSSPPVNDVIEEVGRLSNTDKNNNDLQVTPTPVDKTLTIGDAKVNLSDQQRYDLQNKVGQATQTAWDKLIKSDTYKSLSDIDKASALSQVRKDTTAVTQRQYVADNKLGTYTKSLTNAQKNIVNGTSDLTSYAKNGSAVGATVNINNTISGTSKSLLEKYNSMSTDEQKKYENDNNNAEYNYNFAKYENDKANGTLSDAQKLTGQKSLRKDKIGVDYSKNVRDLYNVSRQELADYLTTNDGTTDKNKIGEQLKAYDKALFDSGATTSLKYKYGIAPADKGSGSKKSKATTAGKALVSLNSSLNKKLAAPHTTGSQTPKSGGLPQMKKVGLKRYTVKGATVSKGAKNTQIKTSKA